MRQRAQEMEDPALQCLVAGARLVGININAKQLRHSYVFSNAAMDEIAVVRAARELGLRAGILSYAEEKPLPMIPCPAIAPLQDGSSILLLGQDGSQLQCWIPQHNKIMLISDEQLRQRWKRQLIPIAKKDASASPVEKLDWRWLIHAASKYKKGFGIVLIFSVFMQGFNIIAPLFMQETINYLLVHHSLDTLNVLAFGMICACFFRGWLAVWRRFIMNHYASKLDTVLSAKLFYHLLRLPLSFFERMKTGDIITRMRELASIRRFVVSAGLTALLDVLFAVIYLVILFLYNTQLTLITLVALLCFVIINLVLTPYLRRRLKTKFQVESRKQGFLFNILRGMETIKTLSVEKSCRQRWDELMAAQVRASFAIDNINNAGNNLARTIQQLTIVAILWFGVQEIMDGNFTVGELVAFQMYTGYVISPIVRLSNMWQDYQQTKVSLHYLDDISMEPPEDTIYAKNLTTPAIKGDIRFEDVSFRYPGAAGDNLSHIDLHIPAGGKIGIVGKSGSGKSTLAKLIQRFYPPSRGNILLDGLDTANIEISWLRQQMGVVTQDTKLFRGTIQENIALPKNGASHEEIRKASIVSGADAFIQELPQRYGTLVSEGGNTLSGGQKQRVAIARALIRDPQILIFDEATSALDTESEQLLRQNLQQISAGRTLLMIAHRLSMVQDCDCIIYMENGRILERGTHDALMEKKGAYYHLYCQQAG